MHSYSYCQIIQVNMDMNTNIPNMKTGWLFDIKLKWNTIHQIDKLVSSGSSQRKAGASAGIPYCYYHRWKNLIKKVDDINVNMEFVPYNRLCSSNSR